MDKQSPSLSTFDVSHRDDGAQLIIRLSNAATLMVELDETQIDELRDQLERPVRSQIPTPLDAKPQPRPIPGPHPAPASPSAPPAAPVFSTRTGQPAPAAVSPDDLEVFDSAEHYRQRLNISLDDLAAAVNSPDDEWVDEDGVATIVLRDDFAAVIGARTGAIMSVMPATKALEARPSNGGGSPRGRGGQGTRYPTTLPELHKRLADCGATVEHSPNGHFIARHQGAAHTIAATPSDRRSLINVVKSLERELHLDLRRPLS